MPVDILREISFLLLIFEYSSNILLIARVLSRIDFGLVES